MRVEMSKFFSLWIERESRREVRVEMSKFFVDREGGEAAFSSPSFLLRVNSHLMRFSVMSLQICSRNNRGLMRGCESALGGNYI